MDAVFAEGFLNLLEQITYNLLYFAKGNKKINAFFFSNKIEPLFCACLSTNYGKR